jgi:anion-transporting  ArsA/GET3 family ATPase
MQLVVGKGGVGRTTIAALLAHRAHERGRRTLFISLGQREEELDAARELLPEGVAAIAIEGEAALAEYLRSAIASRWLHHQIVHHELYRRFVAVAPGLRELMALGKVCNEERSGAWDEIIVDAPPAGHALEYLAMPASAIQTFGRGLVGWEASRMLRELRDPARCRICPVAIPEELPIHELDMIRERVRELGFHLGSVFVNRVRESPVPLARLEPQRSIGATAASAIACARIESAWAELHRDRIVRLKQSAGGVVAVPMLACRAFGREQIEELARAVPC